MPLVKVQKQNVVTVFKTENKCCVVDVNGNVFCNSSDSECIQEAVNIAKPYSRIFIKSGIYCIENSIVVDKPISLEGEQLSFDIKVLGVSLIVPKDNITVFDLGPEGDVTKVYQFGFYNLQIWGGNCSNPTELIRRASTVFRLRSRVRHTVFRNIFIRQLQYGVYAVENALLQNIYFENTSFEEMSKNGIMISPSSGGYNIRLTNVYGGWGTPDSGYTFFIKHVSDVFINNLWLLGHNVPHNYAYYGLLVDILDRATISNVIANNPFENIVMAVISRNATINNVIIGGSKTTFGAILLDSENAVVSNVIIKTPTVGTTKYAPRYGIYIRDQSYTSGVNILQGIIIEDATTDWINTTSKTILKSNVVFRDAVVT